MYWIISIWKTEFPWEESRMTISRPASTRRARRSRSEGRVPTAAAAYSCLLFGFLEARG